MTHTTTLRTLTTTLAVATLLTLGACSNMTRSQQNTAMGAGVGAAAGAILTGGSVIGTGVGAAVGGVIGNEANKR